MFLAQSSFCVQTSSNSRCWQRQFEDLDLRLIRPVQDSAPHSGVLLTDSSWNASLPPRWREEIILGDPRFGDEMMTLVCDFLPQVDGKFLRFTGPTHTPYRNRPSSPSRIFAHKMAQYPLQYSVHSIQSVDYRLHPLVTFIQTTSATPSHFFLYYRENAFHALNLLQYSFAYGI